MALAISHPGFTPKTFDAGVRKAMEQELCIQRTSRASVVAVSSSEDPDVSYLVTRQACSCPADRRWGRCKHRALAIAWWDVFSQVEVGAARYAEEPETA